MVKINDDTKIIKDIKSLNLFKNEPFFLYDVGARGGIEEYWMYNFGGDFKSIGFEPDSDEVNRLNVSKNTDLVKYYDYAIRDYKSEWFQVYERFSSMEAFLIKNQQKRGISKTTSIDNFTKKNKIENVDFIKIDTDGYDYEVIKSSIETLSSKNVLGLLVECQFHGSSQDKNNKFSNISDLLYNLGFTVFDLSVWRYSRSVLPGKFLFNLYGQTERGQVAFADVLFIRDYCRLNYVDEWGELSIIKQLKLVCIFELFDLLDCAAELLLKIKNDKGFNDETINKWLDYLAVRWVPGVSSYSDLINKFNQNPDLLFPNNS